MPSVCPHCDKPFQRPEHLKRHIGAVHDRSGKDFACGTCGKTFSRSDSCLRHERNHAGSDGVVVLEHGRRTRRACDHCAAARTKCDGNDHCSRCRTRELQCTYSKRQSKSALHEAITPDQQIEATDQPEVDLQYQCLSTPGDLPAQQQHQLGPQEPSNFFTAGPAQQDLSAFTPVDMDLLWSEHLNWLPVGNDVDSLAMTNPDLGTLWDPFRSMNPPVPALNDHALYPGISPQTQDSLASADTAMISPASSGSFSAISPESRNKRRRLSRYVDGQGARDSLQNQSHHLHESIERHANTYEHGLPPVLEFPENTVHDTALSSSNSLAYVGAARYGAMKERFDTIVNSTCQTFTPRLLTTHFPSLEYVEHCFNLYLQHLQREWPVIHTSVWTDDSAPWFLTLAAVTAGASRAVGEASQKTCIAFLEFLRRALHCVEESGECRGSLALAQACMLHAVAAAQMPGHMFIHRSSTAVASLRVAVAALPRQHEGDALGDSASVQQPVDLWRQWIFAETRRRILLYEWQLRLLLSVSLDVTEHPGMPADDINLPCSMALWDAGSMDAWNTLDRRKRPPRLWSALESLYVAHSVQTELDATSQYLLVYAVVGRTQEVYQHLQQPLRQWSPAPDEESSSDEKAEDVLPSVGWLPANPQYASWRNSACDCLDTLHWKANSEIAAAKGLEGPIILHLHLARLILLCPYQALTQLAADLAQVPSHFYGISTEAAGTHNTQPFNATPAGKRAFDSVAKWMTLDDHKQRLSLVHAGAIFWHIRRYAKGSFVEPFAVFVATLAIWFTGCFQPSLQASLLENKSRLAEQRKAASRPSRSERHVNDNHSEAAAQGPEHGGGGRGERAEAEADEEEDEDDTAPTSILLDRPCDDEIVQTFVRRGHGMQVLMSGAGPVHGAYGMRRVLQEGIKLLRYRAYGNNARCGEYERILGGIKRKVGGVGGVGGRG